MSTKFLLHRGEDGELTSTGDFSVVTEGRPVLVTGEKFLT